jgi:hypothetical protein
LLICQLRSCFSFFIFHFDSESRQIHGEVLQTLLALFSTQLYSRDCHSVEQHLFLSALINHSDTLRPARIIRTLIEIFINHQTTEQLPSLISSDSNNSVGFWWSAIARLRGDSHSEKKTPSIGQLSLFVLLIIIHHPTAHNPYRQWLFSISDSQCPFLPHITSFLLLITLLID